MNSMLSGVVDELGGGKFANGAVTGSFSYLFNETLHRIQDRGDSDDYDSVLANITKAGGTALAISQADSPALGPADVIALTYFCVVADQELQKLKVYITYTLTNDKGQIYVGRSSGFGSPEAVMKRRFYAHHMRLFNFNKYKIDKAARGPGAYEAIRGREQQLMDSLGGIGSPKLANRIRGVSAINIRGREYHNMSNLFFGNIAPYTGIW